MWYHRNVGVDGAGDPPVPISNTVVKPSGAEDTCLVTGWENRKMPTFLFFVYICISVSLLGAVFYFEYMLL